MQAAQQAFAIQKACVVPGFKDLFSLQARKGWGNQSSETTPSRVHLLTMNQLVLMSNFVHPLHPTYTQMGQEWDTSDAGRATKDAPRCPSLLTYVCQQVAKRWKSNGHSRPRVPRNSYWKRLGRRILSHPAFGEAWAEATCTTQKAAILAYLSICIASY